MEITLLLMSFIFHGISFIIIFFLYQKLKKATEAENQFEKRIHEVEDLFNSYLLELKDENKKFIGLLNHLDQEKQVDNEKEVQTQSDLNNKQVTEKNVTNPIEKPFQYELNSLITKTEEQLEHYIPDQRTMKDEFENLSVESQIMHLYSTGYSIEQIAKKLNRGNTEVELIIKFHSKNEGINT